MTIKEARKLYVTTCETKQKLENDFGKKIISDKVTERVKTYEDCCEEIGETPVDIEVLRRSGLTEDEIAYRMLKTVTRVINEGWMPDMLDTDEYKWYPYFKVDPSSPSGFAFDAADYDYSDAGAGDASRLCFKSEADAIFAGKTFIDLYIKFIK